MFSGPPAAATIALSVVVPPVAARALLGRYARSAILTVVPDPHWISMRP